MSLGPNLKAQPRLWQWCRKLKNGTQERSGARAGDVSGTKPQGTTKIVAAVLKTEKQDLEGVKGKGGRCLSAQTLRLNWDCGSGVET